MYDQMTDRDDLIIAREELENLGEWLSQRGDESDENGYLHGIDTAVTVLSEVIAGLPNPDNE